MTGTEFGVAAGIVGAIFGGAANWVRERYKGENDAKKLAIQADQQEADQAKQLAPVWQAIVADLKEQAAEMRAEVKLLRTQVSEMAVNNARLDTAYGILQERVRVLEGQLAEAGLKHSSDAALIARLTVEKEAKEDELEDALARVIAAERRVEEMARMLDGRNQPDYTGMGGPPKVDATAFDTISDKPKGAQT